MKRFTNLICSLGVGAILGIIVLSLVAGITTQVSATEYKITIVQSPQDVTVCEGQNVTLSVQATTDYPNAQFGYQWLFENRPLTDGGKYSGTTTNTLTISNVSSAEAGDYTVVVSVTNATGVNPVTALARVTVIPAPTITQHPQDVTVCSGQQATMSVTVTGGLNVRYQWYVAGVAVPGETRSSISRTVDETLNGAQVYCRISSDCGDITSNTATLTVETPPTITRQPQGGTAAIGRSFQMTVQATGTAPLQYQWFKDNQPISGATSNTYTITNVTANDAGQYKVVITNRCGTVESEVVTVQALSAEEEAFIAGYRLRIDPSPASESATVVLTTPTAAPAMIEVVDLSGRTVATLWSGVSGGAEQKIETNVAFLAPGMYRCILRSGTYRLSAPLVIVR
ncbi:MAG: immunoglobulin domain-containing protein [Bacteroidota bacterium]|nr:immunoglobulin domain-containing protein [Chlorobiota bacterium]MDW8075519.1 immunoglobulin domain-containing protein [Bacteroidota bacterium]